MSHLRCEVAAHCGYLVVKDWQMPESKHRRKGKERKRPSQMAPPPKNPLPSPTWVPILGVGLILVGFATILAGYLVPPLTRLTQEWPIFAQNWPLAGGFGMLIAGFGVLTKWR